jgi:hypothetical protein
VNINSGSVNVISEQMIFYSFASHHNQSVGYLLPLNGGDDLGLFCGADKNRNYVHCFGTNKKRKAAYSHLQWKLKSDYPEYYCKINDLIRTSEI